MLIIALLLYVGSFFVITGRSIRSRWEGYLKHTPRVVKYGVGLKEEWEASLRKSLGFRYADNPDLDRAAYYFYWPAYFVQQKLLPKRPVYKRLPLLGDGAFED